VGKDSDLDDVVERIYSKADEKGVHMPWDRLALATMIRDGLCTKIRHSVVLARFETGTTKDGGVIVD